MNKPAIAVMNMQPGVAVSPKRDAAIMPGERRALLLRMMGALQETIDLGRLVERFARELKLMLPYDSLEYRHAGYQLRFVHGTLARHSCDYELKVAETSLGAVTFTRRRRFSDSEIELLEYLLTTFIYPVRNALQYQDAINAAACDSLTGLANRKSFDQLLRREVSRSNRLNSHLALLVVDLDDFKQINDRFGHLAGDQALVDFATLLRDAFRGPDLVFRYGGDEFVILLPDTDVVGAERVAERIRLGTAELESIHEGHRLCLRISIGATAMIPGESKSGFLARADRMLFSAKQSGRNRVSVGEA